MKRNGLKKLFVLSASFTCIFACSTHQDSNRKITKPESDIQHLKLPIPDHIVIVIEENHSYSEIMGSAHAPYITSLSKDPYSANFINSFATTHPSQPNYLELFSGSNQGVTDNSHPANAPFTTVNLAGELIAAAKSYCTYAEGLPQMGYNEDINQGYVRKHNPSANWIGNSANQIPATTNQPLSSFPQDYSILPTVSIVIPNDNNNMHDGSIGSADEWLKDHLNNYVQWAKKHNSLFILTFDEDDNYHGNHIVTIFTGAMVKSGQYSEQINHFNLLRTIEEMYHLHYTGYAATVKPIATCWK
jgi:hypothetical protein